jgi:hypothetical protein
MRLVQFLDDHGRSAVGRIAATGALVDIVAGVATMYELAQAAIAQGTTLETQAQSRIANSIPYVALLEERRLLTPLSHPDPAHCRVSGTGLTHLGSADARDAMHRKLEQQESEMSDSMRMFKWGVEGGRPDGDLPGTQPEWFYKGDGSNLVHPGQPILSPDFALDAGEEPELVGLYVIGADGTPHRLGFAVGNEFSDHVTERANYLYLAHSKLRQCAVGPELRTGPLLAHLQGHSRIRRDGAVLWEKSFVTGEANMCHSLANLEYHHFKYAAHRRPGDVHLHFFGTATVSFSDSVRVQDGDRFEIELDGFGLALVNPVQTVPAGFQMRGVSVL